MANFNERRTTLSRLSKLQLEIQHLTDSISQPRSRPSSSKYVDKASSQPTSTYMSELEAKYVGKGCSNIEYSSGGRLPSNKNQSWTSDRLSGSSSSSASHVSIGTSYKPQANPSLCRGRETAHSSRGAGSLVNYSQSDAGRQSSSGSAGIESFLGSGSRLREIEEKYLHRTVSAVLTQPRPGLLSSPTDTNTQRSLLSSRGPSRVEHPSRSWTSPRIRGKSPATRKIPHHVTKPTPQAGSYGSDYKTTRNKYSWKQPADSSKLDARTKRFRSETAHGPRSLPVHGSRTLTSHEPKGHSVSRDSTGGRHQPAGAAQSKYRLDSRSSSASHSGHKHTPLPSTASSSRLVLHPGPSTNARSSASQGTSRTSTSKPVATSSSHSASRSKPRATPSSTQRSHQSFPSTSPAYHGRRDSGYVSSRSRGSPRFRGTPSSRGFSSLRSPGYSGSRGHWFLSSRGQAFSTQRGRGFTIFRGRGTRGYYSSRARGRSSTRSRGSFFRGRGAQHLVSSAARDWKVPHKSSYHGKDSDTLTFSSAKKSPQSNFHTRYALRKSQGRAAQKKPMSFMEKRSQTVLSNTPVLLRSRYKLVKGRRRSGLRPALSATSLLTPVRRSADARRLVTVKNTRTKLIRRAEGDKRPSGSLVTLQGDRFKLRINRFSKTLYRLPAGPQAAPQDSPKNTPSTSKGVVRMPGHTGHALVLKSTAPSVTRKVASQVLQRSIYTSLAAKQRLKKQANAKQYCMFYNLYGRCKRGDACPFIHDPEKVAVCTRFLRGTCPKTDGSCLFSHKVSKEKMPVCSYFLRGVCNRDDCPYSHVKVSSTAIICPDFVKGYCPLGAKCKKKHVLRCAEFSKTGKCENGKKCPLLHKKEAATSSRGKAKTGRPDKRSTKTDGTDTRTPAKRSKTAEAAGVDTPSFIKLDSDRSSEKTAPSLSEEGASVAPSDGLVSPDAAQSTANAEVEGGSIIPSFVKLSSVDKAKETAPSSGVVKLAVVQKSDPGGTPPEDTIVSPTAPSISEDDSHPDTRSIRADPSPHGPRRSSPPSRGSPGQRSPVQPDRDAEGVTAPSLASREHRGTPSFIELYADGTLDDSMEDSADVAHQEHKPELQIRPHFLR